MSSYKLIEDMHILLKVRILGTYIDEEKAQNYVGTLLEHIWWLYRWKQVDYMCQKSIP